MAFHKSEIVFLYVEREQKFLLFVVKQRLTVSSAHCFDDAAVMALLLNSQIRSACVRKNSRHGVKVVDLLSNQPGHNTQRSVTNYFLARRGTASHWPHQL
jgi:hypothetical protein